MPTELTSEHPNLRQAATRLRRTLWIWAALAAGMGLLTAAPAGGGELVPAIGWLVAAVLMALFAQPVLLASPPCSGRCRWWPGSPALRASPGATR